MYVYIGLTRVCVYIYVVHACIMRHNLTTLAPPLGTLEEALTTRTMICICISFYLYYVCECTYIYMLYMHA